MTDWFSTGEDRTDEPTCISAGVDIIMPGGKKVVRTLQKAYHAGTLSADILRSACAHLLKLILKGTSKNCFTYISKLNEAGVKAQCDVFDGSIHAFDFFPTKNARDAKNRLCLIWERDIMCS